MFRLDIFVVFTTDNVCLKPHVAWDELKEKD